MRHSATYFIWAWALHVQLAIRYSLKTETVTNIRITKRVTDINGSISASGGPFNFIPYEPSLILYTLILMFLSFFKHLPSWHGAFAVLLPLPKTLCLHLLLLLPQINHPFCWEVFQCSSSPLFHVCIRATMWYYPSASLLQRTAWHSGDDVNTWFHNVPPAVSTAPSTGKHSFSDDWYHHRQLCRRQY